MIVRRFLLWIQSAPAGDRAEAAAALARAFLFSDLSPADRQEAETALVALLDDPSCLVRRAIAEALAASPNAPRTVIVALATDTSEVAEPVLALSPLLLDCDLVDCAALGDARAQVAIACRSAVSPSLAAALAEVAGPEAALALARNPGAWILDTTFARLIERQGEIALVREALLVRSDLPLESAQAIAAAIARSLERFVVGCGWLSPERSDRVVREARERTTVALSADAAAEDVGRLMTHLRRSAQLTPALILRAILSGQGRFAQAAVAELSGVPLRRVEAAFADRRGQAFAMLYGRAGLPAGLRPAFEAARQASRGTRQGQPSAALSRDIVARALETCSTLPQAEAGRLVALLRRFESEAARAEARQMAGALADEAALMLVRRYQPDLETRLVSMAA